MARFFRRGKSLIKFLPAVAGTSPTGPEFAAGTDLSPQIGGIGGFQLQNNPIETPDLATSFTSQINGPDTTDASTLTIYDDDSASTIRNLLAKGTVGVIVLEPYGHVSGKRCEVWRVTSTGVNDQWSLDATAAQFMVGLAVNSVPTQAGTIP